ncbi:MAG: rhomboid family intramembrane serine protease [Flavobacteriales bacterium]|jgi:membrane associated rhomboid family serine protease|nr:rhomboid family intramembrane serine protease [Flavobacteriales bacterium]MDG2059157.1 rhomboid family intramembrane serine protease [Flavobacteriales bacterium]
MKKNLSHIINVMFIPILFVFAIWFVKGYEIISESSFSWFAISPSNTDRILNIFTFPFIHADFSHLLNNTYPIIILGGIISSVYKEISNSVFFLSYILSGIIFWFLGDSTPVIGASGIVYALGSFILVSGFIKKQPRLAMLSFLVIFLNFFNLWGIIEIEQDNISQTAHLSGAIAGLIIAVLFRNKGPQEKIYNYELEEELEIEEERKDIEINYIYKKEE